MTHPWHRIRTWFARLAPPPRRARWHAPSDPQVGTGGPTYPPSMLRPLAWPSTPADARGSGTRSRRSSVLDALGRTVRRAYASLVHRRRQRQALRVALSQFSRLHPDWYDAFFDDAFLDRLPASELDRVDGLALAREWARQFRYRDARKRELEVKRLAPVAEDFLMLRARAEANLGLRTHRPRAGGHTSAAETTRVGEGRTEVARGRTRAPSEPAAPACC